MIRKLTKLSILISILMFSCENASTETEANSKLMPTSFKSPELNVENSNLSANHSTDEVILTFTVTDAGAGWARVKVKFDNGSYKWARNASTSFKFPVSSGSSKTITFDRFYDGSTFNVPDNYATHTVSVEIYGVDVNGNIVSQGPWNQSSIQTSYTLSLDAPVISQSWNGNMNPVISWSAVSGATSYDVYRNLSPSGYVKIATISSNSYTDSNRKSGVSGPSFHYTDYKVKANGSGGSSSYSNEVFGLKTLAYFDEGEGL